MKKIILLFALSIFVFSCSETTKKPTSKKEVKNTKEMAANYKSLEVDIEGMTCEIGCARTIQSKLSKMDGVVYSKVNFEAKKGQFTYDANKLSENDIVQKINGIAGGDLYKVVKATELKDVIYDKVN